MLLSSLFFSPNLPLYSLYFFPQPFLPIISFFFSYLSPSLSPLLLPYFFPFLLIFYSFLLPISSLTPSCLPFVSFLFYLQLLTFLLLSIPCSLSPYFLFHPFLLPIPFSASNHHRSKLYRKDRIEITFRGRIYNFASSR